jgi:hypothetical protein
VIWLHPTPCLRRWSGRYAHDFHQESLLFKIEKIAAAYLLAGAEFEIRLVGRPAALLLIEPKGVRADAVLEVGHPTGAYVDDASYGAREQPHEQHAHPSRPGVVGASDQVPDRVLLLLDDVAVAHAVARNVPLPVDGVKILILADARDVVALRRPAKFHYKQM